MNEQKPEPEREPRATLGVERLVPGGHGFVRRADGEALLVPGALPGDRIELLRESRKRGVGLVEAWRLVEPSRDRVDPVCEVAAECGGCDLMALSDSAQERAKRALFVDALERFAHLDPALLPSALTRAGPALGYRNRLRLQINDRGQVGFFRKGSHELVQPRRCHVARPEIDHALGVLRKLGRKKPKALAAFAYVEVRVSEAGTSLYFALRPELGWVPIEASSLLNQLAREFLVATSSENAPTNLERFQLSDTVYLYAQPGSFTQVNWAVNRELVARVTSLALAAEVREFLDLYCGSGNFSLPLLGAGLTGVGVEASRSAIQAALSAAREQGLPGRFVVDDAIRYAKAREREKRSYDLVLVDPPRAGVKEGLATVAALAHRSLALVSCDPVTFARDLRGLLDRGFRLEHLEAFDMFPQTHHLEAFAWLERVA